MKTRLRGYQGIDPVSHRKYSRSKSIARYKRTGSFTYRGTKVGKKMVYGLGHAAGERWADQKSIDPNSRIRKYSKNSPSFDEGVYQYKERAKAKSNALKSKIES